MLRAKQEVFKELLQILASGMDALLQIVVVGADERVAEIPGVGREHIVVHYKAEGLQILHDENRSRARVAYICLDFFYAENSGKILPRKNHKATDFIVTLVSLKTVVFVRSI